MQTEDEVPNLHTIKTERSVSSYNNLLSVVIPCFNEEETISETYHQLITTLNKTGINFELIFVDDGSSDSTLAQLQKLHRADNRVKIVILSRNFGHQIALTAGLDHVIGNVVVIIDADLQDPPEVILEMLNCWHKGADIAYGVRVKRTGETFMKRWSAKLFYRLMACLTDIPIPLDTGDFRLMDKKLLCRNPDIGC